MLDHAQQLHARLTTLGKVPEGLELYQRGPDRPQWYFHDLLLHDFAVLGLLCNAARRVCDERRVEMNIPTGPNGPWQVWEADKPDEHGDLFSDYESALIAGLDWIIEKEADRG